MKSIILLMIAAVNIAALITVIIGAAEIYKFNRSSSIVLSKRQERLTKKPKAISAMQKNGDAKPNTLKKSL